MNVPRMAEQGYRPGWVLLLASRRRCGADEGISQDRHADHQRQVTILVCSALNRWSNDRERPPFALQLTCKLSAQLPQYAHQFQRSDSAIVLCPSVSDHLLGNQPARGIEVPTDQKGIISAIIADQPVVRQARRRSVARHELRFNRKIIRPHARLDTNRGWPVCCIEVRQYRRIGIAWQPREDILWKSNPRRRREDAGAARPTQELRKRPHTRPDILPLGNNLDPDAGKVPDHKLP